MDELEFLQPTENQRVYDLVAACGANVEDWGNYARGPSRASQNPKYCYEWGFEEPGQFVVLCLWFEHLRIDGESIYQEPDPRPYSEELRELKPKPGNIIGRALRMDEKIAKAYNQRLPVRAIIVDGSRRDRTDQNSKASSVNHRLLDPVPWTVTSYDPLTGRCKIIRGSGMLETLDQFSVPIHPARKRERYTESYVRDRALRDAALRRANGRCEYCGNRGFRTKSGHIYLETHHVVPLSENGADDEKNIVGLCASDHRAAHYADNWEEIREELKRVLSRHYA